MLTVFWCNLKVEEVLINIELLEFIQRQGYKLDSILEKDKKLQLRELTPITKKLTKLHSVTMIPIRVKNAPKEHYYLWLV